MNILLIFAIFLQIFANFLIAWLAYRWLKRKQNDVIDAARAYFESPGDDKPSQFGMFVDILADKFASNLMRSARAQLANMASITPRQIKGLESESIQESLPGVLANVPGVGRMIQKNPLLGLAAQYLISKMPGQTPRPVESVAGNNHHSDPFRV
jgi:hypothetical protein